MQSGISASPSLLSAFSSFTTSPSLFALPISIAHESLQPLEPIPFASKDFATDLKKLSPHLQPKTPIYLLIRRRPESSRFVAVTYVPSTAPVRSKTLFASTRSALVRELGGEKFEATLFCTDAEEVLDPKAWEERDGTSTARTGGATEADEAERRLELLSVEERELEGVKRAEEEERHGTQGRQLGGLGGGGGKEPGSGRGTPSGGIRMKVGDKVKSALQDLGRGGAGMLLILGIDVQSETLQLLESEEVRPEEVSRRIPGDRPSYSFYRHAQATAEDPVLFIYVCPGSSKVKERMLYASSRNGVLEIAKSEGVVVGKRLEAGDPEEVGVERLAEEVGAKAVNNDGQSKQGFSKPKRPGRR